MMIPTITTERLILRAPMESDFPAMRDFYASAQSEPIGGPLEPRDAWRRFMGALGHWALRGYGFWTVALKGTNTPIGNVGILNSLGWDEPELGWHLYGAHTGQNYAFEAATAARAYAPTFGLDGLISYIMHDNTRSRHLAERLGAVVEREGEVVGLPCLVYRHPKVGG